MPTDRDQLEQLILRGHACVAVRSLEERYVLELLRTIAVDHQRPLWLWTVSQGLVDGLLAGGRVLSSTDKPVNALAHLAELRDRSIAVMLDLAAHLQDAAVLRALRTTLMRIESTGLQIVLLDHSDELPAVIAAETTPFAVSLPDEAELERIVRDTLRRANSAHPIRVELRRSEFQAILRNLRGLTRRQVERIVEDVISDDRRFDAADAHHVIAEKRRLLVHSGLLEFVETPVDLNAIGGLRRLKSWLRRRAGALSDAGQKFGLPAPRGVLLLGVQGAGKSLSAKAIATAWQRPLLRMDVGALYDRYVGESERRLRDTLRQAEGLAPIVLWIDEIEKAFASAASRSTDGGLSQRMFGTLLTWMQEHRAPVFLVATANDIEALPPELLRKGRFDEIFFVDLPDRDVRCEIAAIHLRQRGRDPAAFDLNAIAEASAGHSGAEIEQAVIGGLHAAFDAKAELTTAHIVEALDASPPLSVTMAERVAALRAWAVGRCVPAD
jgi:hypothetical protein